MSDSPNSTDELAGTEQPFVQHLVELRDRLLYGVIGLALCMVALAIWPGPGGLIDLIAVPIKAHMPPDAKLIAVGVFTPFFIPLKVLMMAAVLMALPWLMYQMWAFVAPGLYSHEKRFAIPLIVLGSLLAASMPGLGSIPVTRAGSPARRQAWAATRPWVAPSATCSNPTPNSKVS